MAVTVSARAPAQALEYLRVNVIVGRAKARLSQEELARRSKVGRPTISRIERGAENVGIDVVQRIADALGLSVADLFVSPNMEPVSESKLARRAAASDDEFIEADAFFEVLKEADDLPGGGRQIQRYSRAGRPPMER